MEAVVFVAGIAAEPRSADFPDKQCIAGDKFVPGKKTDRIECVSRCVNNSEIEISKFKYITVVKTNIVM